MRPRQNLVEIFSTFLQFDGDRVSGWATDGRLRRSMQGCLEQSNASSTADHFWALYWYKIWQAQSQPLAEAHLSAYLQEVGYWAAQKTATSFASSQYTLSDCFQIAIARIATVLKGFNPKQGSSLKNYAASLFSSAIKELLRQRQEVDICTDWALLRKLSQKRLIESLQNTGIPAEAIARYVLAWNCFKTLYVPNQATATRKLSKPDPDTWAAIAKLYNAERHNQVVVTEPQASIETLEKWLLASAKAARTYLYPNFVSINAPQPEQGEFIDNLPETAQDSVLAELIAEEEQRDRQDQLAQISTALTAAIANLDPPSQQLLQLYYQQSLTQQQMAAQLDMKQYTVSRRLTKARETLLLALTQWSRDTLHITLTSDVLKDTSTVLEEWLQTHYSPSDSLSRPEQSP
ncbi:MAG TPA: sigma-70 family RNA polymerase sigma factor [Allocoleopsis sp.]